MNTRERARSHLTIPRRIALIGVSLVLSASMGCSDKRPATWARKLSVADLETWGAACGTLEPAASIDDNAMIARSWHGDRGDGIKVLCHITWDVPHARLSYVSFAIVAPPNFEPTAELIEPYVQLLEREVPFAVREKIRALAPPRLGETQVGKLFIDSTLVPDPRAPSMWMLTVRLRP